MKRLLVIISIALLIMGHTLSLQKKDILIGAPDDLIEIHNINKADRTRDYF